MHYSNCLAQGIELHGWVEIVSTCVHEVNPKSRTPSELMILDTRTPTEEDGHKLTIVVVWHLLMSMMLA
jgi:hypothetical protein